MVYKYKAKNGLDFFIPGIGRSSNGILITNRLLECNSIELMNDQTVEASQIAQPGAVIGVAPQATIMSQSIESVAPILNNIERES